MARECPDRQHPGVRKGKGYGGKSFGGKDPGKHAHFMDPDWHWDLAFQKGKYKSKGANWANVYDAAYAYPFGKGKGKFKSTKSGQVNAYVADYYGLEMEAGARAHGNLHAAEANSARVNAERKPSQGMLDTGATASAGPERADPSPTGKSKRPRSDNQH